MIFCSSNSHINKAASAMKPKQHKNSKNTSPKIPFTKPTAYREWVAKNKKSKKMWKTLFSLTNQD